MYTPIQIQKITNCQFHIRINSAQVLRYSVFGKTVYRSVSLPDRQSANQQVSQSNHKQKKGRNSEKFKGGGRHENEHSSTSTELNKIDEDELSTHLEDAYIFQ